MLKAKKSSVPLLGEFNPLEDPLRGIEILTRDIDVRDNNKRINRLTAGKRLRKQRSSVSSAPSKINYGQFTRLIIHTNLIADSYTTS